MLTSLIVAVSALAAQPLPDKASIDAAGRIAKDTYQSSLADKEKLSGLLDEGDKFTADAASQAAVYMLVAKCAADQGWLRVAFDAIDRLSRRFEYDGLAAKARLLSAANKQAKTVDARVSLANRCFELIDAAVSAGNFDVADDAAKLASQIVPRLRDAEMRKELATKRKELDKLKRDHDASERELEDAQRALERDSANGHANTIVGLHYASKGDWQKALHCFSLADDQRLRDAARHDAAATDAGKQLAAADAWWNVAAARYGQERRSLQSRAVYWYSLAMPSLSGILKSRAEKRIEEAGSVDLAGQTSGDDSKVTILLAPGVPLVLVKIPPSADGKVKGFWLGQTEVTQKQWLAVMGSNPSNFKGPDNPVDTVTLAECEDFCRRVGEKSPRFVFRLPTIEEHKHVQFAAFEDIPVPALHQFAWEVGNCGEKTHPAGKMKADKLGLFDLVGNVYERSNVDTVVMGGSWHDQQRDDPGKSHYLCDIKKGDKGINIGLRVAADLR